MCLTKASSPVTMWFTRRPVTRKGRSMSIANEGFWFGTLVLGVFVTLGSLQVWGAKKIEKNKPVKLVTFRNGKCYKFACSSIQEAAAYALQRLATGEGVAYIEANGETVWNSLKGKQSLVELAK
jgi:hypothetical protein